MELGFSMKGAQLSQMPNDSENGCDRESAHRLSVNTNPNLNPGVVGEKIGISLQAIKCTMVSGPGFTGGGINSSEGDRVPSTLLLSPPDGKNITTTRPTVAFSHGATNDDERFQAKPTCPANACEQQKILPPVPK